MNQTSSVRLSSSLRSRTAEESWAIAAPIAAARGISRVVDTTWLDRIGLPVYASIRPDGIEGTLCVHAGKGFTRAEARIGAVMEAIEFSFAPPSRNIVPWRLAKPIDILASFQHRIRFSDFAPIAGRCIDVDDAIAVVTGEEIMSELGNVLVPAELVYHPFLENTGIRLYGTSTNGLASGNTLLEATVHGLAEVMERHVRSFEVINDQSHIVDVDDAPQKIKAMVALIRKAGLTSHLRYSANDFGLAYFTAYVLEPDEYSPISVSSGFGMHPIAEIAAVRALAEAAQGRLSHIHGGRDDIIKRVYMGMQIGRQTEVDLIRTLRAMACNSTRRVDFASIPNFDSNSLEEAQSHLFDGLERAGLRLVVRVVLTEPSYPFQVVKVLVPGAEMYEHELKRVGPRLIEHARNA
jgi:ribosomal protein S12 methylthiotransferase accessory factor